LFLDQFEFLLDFIAWKFFHWFLSLGSTFSAASLLSALCIAIAFILVRRPRQRDVKLAVMFRAMFPRWVYRSPSFGADVKLLIFNVFVYGFVFGWTVLSSEFINRVTTAALVNSFGVLPKTGLSDLTSRSMMTVFLFLAYELGYWTHHYLSHRIPLLWEFHKVHHTAEVLSPMTSYRVHPVDTIVFQKFLAVFIGVAGGALSYLFSVPISVFSMSGTNMILLAFIFVTVHLQHSHIWIAATGTLGHAVMSPAHHQLHHSDNPAHFNKNFGSCLALWDWMFGTLQIPRRERQRLRFGIEPRAVSHHTAMGGLIIPFINVCEHLIRKSKLWKLPRYPSNVSAAQAEMKRPL
jgi:sterol desaturase/sphingolipid hydroxylase (fatty acid hydroxylase superfamily)